MPPQQRLQQEECSSSHSSERKRRVRFAKSKEVHPIVHIKDMPKEDVRNTWYDRNDFEAMKQSFIPIIRSMMKGETVEESNEQTVRGLEFRTRKGAIHRQHNKLEAITAVLDEQDRQYNEGVLNDELLSETYRACASHCQDAAYMLGLQDEASIRAYLDAPGPEPTKVEDDGDDTSETSELSDEEPVSTEQNDKKLRGLSKMLKQVRIRRRALLDDMRTLETTRSMPQAA